MATFYIHSSNEIAQYQMAWADEVGDGDSISTSTWAIVPTGPTLASPGFVGTTTFVDVSNLSATVRDYVLTNTVVLASGDTYSNSIFLTVEKK